MFKVNNKETRTTPRFTPCSSVSLVNFEYVVAGWDFVILLRQSIKIRNYIHENLVRKFSHVLTIWGSFFAQWLFFLLLIKLFHDQLWLCFIVCTFFLQNQSLYSLPKGLVVSYTKYIDISEKFFSFGIIRSTTSFACFTFRIWNFVSQFRFSDNFFIDVFLLIHGSSLNRVHLFLMGMGTLQHFNQSLNWFRWNMIKKWKWIL